MSPTMQPMRSELHFDATGIQENNHEATLYEAQRTRLNEVLFYRGVSPRYHRRLLKLAAGMIVYAVCFGIWAVVSL